MVQVSGVFGTGEAFRVELLGSAFESASSGEEPGAFVGERCRIPEPEGIGGVGNGPISEDFASDSATERGID